MVARAAEDEEEKLRAADAGSQKRASQVAATAVMMRYQLLDVIDVAYSGVIAARGEEERW